MSKQVFAVVLISTLRITAGEIDDHHEYCNVNNNEFYLPQGTICKKCDRCGPCFGIESLKVRSIETHSTHGAMHCQRCIRCGDGFYSKGYSFKECKPCRNCEAEGRVQQTPCSSGRNSVCGGKTLPSNGVALQSDLIKVDTKKDIVQNQGRLQQKRSHGYIGVIVATIAVVSLMVCLSVLLFCIRKQHRVINQTVDLEQPKTTEQQESNQSEENSALMSVETDSCPCTNILDIVKQGKDEVTILTEKHCLGLSKYIATYDTFYKLGIRIGLSENDIDIIKENYRHSVEEQAYQSLLKWKQSNGESARVVTVLNCLMSMGRRDIVDKFCTTCLQCFVERASEEMNYVKMKGKNVNYSDFS